MFDVGGYTLFSLRTIVGIIVFLVLIIAIFRKPLIGLIAFIFVQLAEYYFMNLNPYLFGTFHIPRLIVIVTIIAFLVHMLMSDFKFYAPVQNWLMLSIFLLMLISCQANDVPVFENQTVGDFLKVVLVYFMVSLVITTKKDVNLCVWALIFSSLIMAFIGFQNTRVSGLNVPYWGMNYNAFGFTLAMLIPPLIIKLVNSKKLFTKSFLGIGLIITVLALLRTGSRKSFLALVIVSLLLFIYLALSKGSRKYLLVIFPLVLILALTRTPDKIWERFSTIQEYEEDRSSMGRIYAWQAGLEMIRENPFVGVGPGNFINLFREYGDQDAIREGKVRVNMTPHNIFVEIGSQFGLPALLLWIMMLLLSFKNGIGIVRDFNSKPAEKEFFDATVALMISCVAWLICGMFGSYIYSADPHIFIALIIASKKFV